MSELMKEWGHVCLGSIAGALLGAAVVFTIEALNPQTVEARTVCNTNQRGNYICKSEGAVTLNGRTDYWGRDAYGNSYSNRTTCSTDYRGRYICR